tara:strand:+ start:1020 stop:2267 length:1248 start_codon:yes stop_codon:yes gene_type:complete
MSITIGGKEITQITLEGPEMEEGLLGEVEVYGKKTEVVIIDPPPPPTGDYRTIFEEVNFNNTSNYTPFGSGTIEVSNGKLKIGTNSGTNLRHGVSYNGYKTALERYRITTKFTIVDPPVSNSNGIGLGTLSQAQAQMEHMCNFTMTSGDMAAGGGRLLLKNRYISQRYEFNSNTQQRLPFAIGDVIELVFEMNREIITATAKNHTQELTIVETYAYPMTPRYLPNIGEFAIFGYKGKYEFSQIKIETDEILNPTFCLVGDSKTKGYFADTHADTFAAQLREQFGSVVNLSGGSERTYNTMERVQEIIDINPVYVFLNIGSNDNREDVSVTDWGVNYDFIVNTLEAEGIQVIHVLIFNETVEDVTPYNNRTIATYPADKILDCGTISLHDGAHPDQQGNDQITAKYAEKMNELLTL